MPRAPLQLDWHLPTAWIQDVHSCCFRARGPKCPTRPRTSAQRTCSLPSANSGPQTPGEEQSAADTNSQDTSNRSTSIRLLAGNRDLSSAARGMRGSLPQLARWPCGWSATLFADSCAKRTGTPTPALKKWHVMSPLTSIKLACLRKGLQPTTCCSWTGSGRLSIEPGSAQCANPKSVDAHHLALPPLVRGHPRQPPQGFHHRHCPLLANALS